MKKSCLGCYAYEDGEYQSKGFCKLGFKTKKIELTAGFYGRNKQLIGCRAAPIENCPKPKTFKQYFKLWSKNS